MSRTRASRPGRLRRSLGGPSWIGRSLVVLAVVSTAVAYEITTEPLASAATPAGLQAEANSIAANVESDNASLAAIGEHYLAAAAVYERDRTLEATSATELRTVRARISRQRTQLYDVAVQAYVAGGEGTSVGFYLTSQPSQLSSSTTYIGVASAQLETTINTLGGSERLLASTLVTERHAIAGAKIALDASTTERSDALATLSSEQTTLSNVKGQLAAAVAAAAAAAERRAEEAAAAAAARAAAAAAAAAAVAATSTTAPGATTTAATTTPGAGPPASVPTAPSAGSPPASLSADFAAIRQCESSDDYSLDTGNGYYGAYQFSASTWTDLGGTGLASAAPPSAQDAAAYRLYQASGWSSWPECAAVAGLL